MTKKEKLELYYRAKEAYYNGQEIMTDFEFDTLEKELGGLEIGTWNKPLGGYFIAFDTIEGCAKRVVGLCKEAGVVMTPAGSTYPYKNDPKDTSIRIAPTLPSAEELKKACEVFVLCVKLASVEKYMNM